MLRSISHRIWLSCLASLLASGTATVLAGDFFHRHGTCSHGNCNETVTLPQQTVVVETTRPRIVVNETVRAGTVAAPVPFVASFYMPAPMPVMGFHAPMGQVGSVGIEKRVSANPLASLHELEAQRVELFKAHVAHETELLAAKQVYDRMSAMSVQSFGAPRLQLQQSQQNCDSDKLKAELELIRSRLTAIEKLVVIHDELLKGQRPSLPMPSKE